MTGFGEYSRLFFLTYPVQKESFKFKPTFRSIRIEKKTIRIFVILVGFNLSITRRENEMIFRDGTNRGMRG